jgi:hypothetical protein
VPGGRSVGTVFFACSLCSFSSSFLIHFGFEFWLDEVSDVRSRGADIPRVPGGKSACSPRTVRVLPLDDPFFRVRHWRFCWLFQTVRGSGPDSPHGPCGQSAPPSRTVRQSLAALLFGLIPPSFLSCFRDCFMESFLRLVVDP